MNTRPDDTIEGNTSLSNSPELLSLVKACGEGQTEALKIFFERFSSDIYNFPVKVFHLDEDAASDFYLYAFERLKDGSRFRSFQGRSSFRTWFYTVLRNLVIDWMRTLRELKTVQVSRTDEEGTEYRNIESTPDPRSLEGQDPALLTVFRNRLQELAPDLRLIFKLAFVYYLDLDDEDIRYLADQSKKPIAEVVQSIAEMRNHLAEKELRNMDAEDKITALYLTILDLKQKRQRLGADTSAQKSKDVSADPAQLARFDRAIQKKYRQRERLLEKKDRGHFIVRTPYRFITALVGIPESTVSVQMMRALEKLRLGNSNF